MATLDKIKKLITPSNPDTEEDPVPYDPNAGTLTNVGRFMANNVAKDPGYAGMLPVGGTMREIGALAEPLVEDAAVPALKKTLPEGAIQMGDNTWAPISKEAPMTIPQIQDKIAKIQSTNPESGEIALWTQKLNTLKDMIARRNR